MPDTATARGSRTLDVTRSGSREYEERQRSMVISALERNHVGAQCATTVADLAQCLGMPGRTVRQIIADADGVEFLLGGGDGGIYLCEHADDGDAMTRRMEASARSLLERAARRHAFSDRIPRMQRALW